IDLLWEDLDTGTTKAVDMDLVLWIDDPNTPSISYEWFFSRAVRDTVNTWEWLFIPAEFVNTNYGVSAVYYDGDSDSLDVYLYFTNLGGFLTSGSTIQDPPIDTLSRKT